MWFRGVVWVRFAPGRAPLTGMSQAGLRDFDAAASPFRVTEIRQAFEDLEHLARKRPMTASMEWLRGVYEVAYSAPVSPIIVAKILGRTPDVEMAEAQPMHITDASPMVAPDDFFTACARGTWIA